MTAAGEHNAHDAGAIRQRRGGEERIHCRPGAVLLGSAIERDPVRLIAMPSALELHIIVEGRLGDEGVRELEFFLMKLEIQKVAMDEKQLEWARRAFHKFGKGRHPAGLNFGDCFSYALAKSTGEMLLFKGINFTKSDLLT